MNAYVKENKRLFIEGLKDTKLIFIEAHALYLLWVDVSCYTLDAKKLVDHIYKTTGLYITPGIEYGEAGKSFVRINLATNKDNVKEAVFLMKEAINSFKI